MSSLSIPAEKRVSSREALLPVVRPSSPPPYYEANAYPAVRSRRLRTFAVLASLRVGVILALAGALTWLMLLRTTRDVERIVLPPQAAKQFEASLRKCAATRTFPTRIEPAKRKVNPRWNAANGQNETVVLVNATLFDGERFVSKAVDIVFDKGLITSVAPTGSHSWDASAARYDLKGQYVTPGLVDMHSHHLVLLWPQLSMTEDGNEMHPDFGPLTPFVRALDGMKAYDRATAMISSGGVTTSLIIPGSANIMGGEGTVVKNRPRAGPNKEYVVEELLLEHGIPFEERNRYMKMACGENPKRTYGHTRMGNAYVFRHHLARAKELLEKQDAWCAAAEHFSSSSSSSVVGREHFLAQAGGFPEELELDSTVGMLRGRVALHNHCYEPEDFEMMMRVSDEYSFKVRAFHHAIAAWQVPEMIKAYNENLTIATFAEFGLYKMEAYASNLYAGKILSDHGVPLAYKSDHSGGPTNAKYLLSQAAIAHSFQVPPDVALRAVTSVPARSIDLDYRVGYVRPGYDADIVVWDSHPLSIGATPRQVFIDGVATLAPDKVKKTMDDQVSESSHGSISREPAVRVTPAEKVKQDFCSKADKEGQRFVIRGIHRSFLENYPEFYTLAHSADSQNLTLVISSGEISCLGSKNACSSHAAEVSSSPDAVIMDLSHGYLAPGLTAISAELGMIEISLDDGTGNGAISPLLDPSNPANIDHAKYGVVLEGKAFARARLGGVTRAVTPPLARGGLVRGVSVGFLTGGKRKLVDGGIVREDVALHVDLGSADKVSPGSISMAVQELRGLLKGAVDAGGGGGGRGVYSDVVKGNLPLVVYAESEHDIQQVILMKRDLVKQGAPDLKVVIHGGHGAHYVARELAEASIPVILTANRGSFDRWETKDALPGPPLSRSPASILSEAGVQYALALSGEPPEGDSRIHDLAFEASWAAKYAGLSDREAVRLVSQNVEDILGLEPSKDIVVWEGSPLEFGTPVLAFQAVVPSPGLGGGAGHGHGHGHGSGGNRTRLELVACWPDEGDL